MSLPLAAAPAAPGRGHAPWRPAPGAGAQGVEAGTLLGVGGDAAREGAGEGVVAVERPGGRVELRAARDGAPRVADGRLIVDALRVVEGHVDRSRGDLAVHGALVVEGQIAPGRTVAATGGLRVAGNADRAVVTAGGALVLEGRVSASHLRGGQAAALRRRLARPLGGLGPQLDALAETARVLAGAAAARGRAVSDADALAALAGARFPGLAERIAEGAEAAAAASGDDRGRPGIAAVVRAARRAVEAPASVADPLAAIDEAAGVLAAALPSARPPAEPAMRVALAASCAIEAAGSLWLTGAGATDCDIAVAGDLFAMGGVGLRACRATVGRRVRARELSGRDGRPLELALETHGTDDELLRADVVQPGVVLVAGGERIRIDRRRADVRLALVGGRPQLTSS
ncbi:FapA family protein [Miltoncostaea marina]|uniref:FapA family protein n=1 Tax=Miltoncostaea marina TaxID=2843215 RepID=UPI001C3C7F52|nr:FapA family protein [Miltoncostaea marina]